MNLTQRKTLLLFLHTFYFQAFKVVSFSKQSILHAPLLVQFFSIASKCLWQDHLHQTPYRQRETSIFYSQGDQLGSDFTALQVFSAGKRNVEHRVDVKQMAELSSQTHGGKNWARLQSGNARSRNSPGSWNRLHDHGVDWHALHLTVEEEIHGQFLFTSSWFQWYNNPKSTPLLIHSEQQGEKKPETFWTNL